MGPFVFDGKSLPEGTGCVNQGDRRTVVKTHFGKVSLKPRQGLIIKPNGGTMVINPGDRVIPQIGGGYRVDPNPVEVEVG